MSNFKKGDIVTLRSNSPKMTVEGFKWNAIKGIYDETIVECIWFIGNVKQSDSFPEETLVKEEKH